MLNFIFAINFSQADYQVSSGNIFHYDMVLAELTASFDNNDYYGNGFDIDGNHLAQGYTCTLIVDTVDSSSVDSTIFGGGYSESFTSYWAISDKTYYTYLIIDPLFKCLNQLMNPTLISNGPGLIFYPFVDTLVAYAYFEEFVYQTNFHLVNYMSHYTDPFFECVSDDNGDFYYFESYLTGSYRIDVGPPEYNIDFKIQVKFAYEKSTGILQGLRYKAQGEGIFQNQNTTFVCESLTEIQGYNLPNFKLGESSFDIAEDWWIIAAAGGGCLLLIVIVIVVAVSASKKKKKPTKKKFAKKRK